MNNTGTPETDAAVMAAGGDWSFPLRECSRRLERQRDEAVEKYATEATEHMLAINKLCNERDAAREEVRTLSAMLDLLKKEAQ